MYRSSFETGLEAAGLENGYCCVGFIRDTLVYQMRVLGLLLCDPALSCEY